MDRFLPIHHSSRRRECIINLRKPRLIRSLVTIARSKATSVRLLPRTSNLHSARSRSGIERWQFIGARYATSDSRAGAIASPCVSRAAASTFRRVRLAESADPSHWFEGVGIVCAESKTGREVVPPILVLSRSRTECSIRQAVARRLLKPRHEEHEFHCSEPFSGFRTSEFPFRSNLHLEG